MIIWLTGAAGSGKTTLGQELQAYFPRSVLLDGDDCRQWLTPDCDFSDEGRLQNVTRAYKVAQLITSAGGTAICCFVHPCPSVPSYEIHLVGRERHPPWEGTEWLAPEKPDIVLDTGKLAVRECFNTICDYVQPKRDKWFTA